MRFVLLLFAVAVLPVHINFFDFFFAFRLFGCFRFYLTISISFDPFEILYLRHFTFYPSSFFRHSVWLCMCTALQTHYRCIIYIILVICMYMFLYVDRERIFAMRLCLCQWQCQCLYLTQYQNSIRCSGSIRSNTR